MRRERWEVLGALLLTGALVVSWVFGLPDKTLIYPALAVMVIWEVHRVEEFFRKLAHKVDKIEKEIAEVKNLLTN